MLPILTGQLQALGMVPEWLKQCLTHNPLLFDQCFRRMFYHSLPRAIFDGDPSTKWAISSFWKPQVGADPEASAGNTGGGAAALGARTSRYLSDFEEISVLGQGGYGIVVLAVNKLDGRKYAIKKIRLRSDQPGFNSRILREVSTLSRLQHPSIVRYYQAWVGQGVGRFLDDESGSESEWSDDDSSEESAPSTPPARPAAKGKPSAAAKVGGNARTPPRQPAGRGAGGRSPTKAPPQVAKQAANAAMMTKPAADVITGVGTKAAAGKVSPIRKASGGGGGGGAGRAVAVVKKNGSGSGSRSSSKEGTPTAPWQFSRASKPPSFSGSSEEEEESLGEADDDDEEEEEDGSSEEESEEGSEEGTESGSSEESDEEEEDSDEESEEESEEESDEEEEVAVKKNAGPAKSKVVEEDSFWLREPGEKAQEEEDEEDEDGSEEGTEEVPEGTEGTEGGGGRMGSSDVKKRRAKKKDKEKKDKEKDEYLYLQMEYCPRTLREELDAAGDSSRVNRSALIWRQFRQILEGLVHIHHQGIIHRDLKPSNIFCDPRGDIKIGDFGLAKFLPIHRGGMAGGPLAAGDDDATHRELINSRGRRGSSVESGRDPAHAAAGGGGGGGGNEGSGEAMVHEDSTTGPVGTYLYTAPEIEKQWADVTEKADMYSLGVVCFEMWERFATGMERAVLLNDLRQKQQLPDKFRKKFPKQSTVIQWLVQPNPADRPTAKQVLRSNLLPPKMEEEHLEDLLRTLQSSENSQVHDLVLEALFRGKAAPAHHHHGGVTSVSGHAEPSGASSVARMPLPAMSPGGGVDGDPLLLPAPGLVPSYGGARFVTLRERALRALEITFRNHGGIPMGSSQFHLVDTNLAGGGAAPRPPPCAPDAVRLMDTEGNILDLRYELRRPLAQYVACAQIHDLKRYEITKVYRRGVGRELPREVFQADFDIISTTCTIADAEVIKVVLEAATSYGELPPATRLQVRLNHRLLLDAAWGWCGIPPEKRQDIAQLLVRSCTAARSSFRAVIWPQLRRQLLEGVRLSAASVDCVEALLLRLSGAAGSCLPRLHGALASSAKALKSLQAALDELHGIASHLATWGVPAENVTVEPLMPPHEGYYSGVLVQVHVQRDPHAATECIAIGGRYDDLIARMWPVEAAFPGRPVGDVPGGVGVSIAVSRLLAVTSSAALHVSSNTPVCETDVLICARGGGGLLQERMRLVAQLWDAGIKAEMVYTAAPSLTEQYEYATERGIKWLVIISQALLSSSDFVKVKHLDAKGETEMASGDVVKFFQKELSAPLRKRAGVHGL
eukprot:jgi/Mesvir1/21937/Mv12105-RA.1